VISINPRLNKKAPPPIGRVDNPSVAAGWKLH
jgi:hypothetical protein